MKKGYGKWLPFAIVLGAAIGYGVAGLTLGSSPANKAFAILGGVLGGYVWIAGLSPKR